MHIINLLFGIPLGYLMYWCYLLTGSYGWAIVVFTLLSKAVLFPISLATQKNSIRMVKIQPMMEEIKRRHEGDKDKIAEEQIALYKREKYSPAVGCLPLLLQIPIILGLINVIYNPLQHLLRFSAETITAFVGRAGELLGADLSAWAPQLQVVSLAHQDPALFEPLRAALPGFEAAMEKLAGFDMQFLGLDLAAIPSLARPNALLLIPLLSAGSALLMSVVQMRINVLTREQGALNRWGTTALMVVISGYFAFIVPAGVGLYWIVGNLAGILTNVLCNMVYNPKKLIDYENRPQKPRLSPEEKRRLAAENKANRAREKADAARFFADENEPRELVFYSAANGFYKYFGKYVEYILDHSDIVLHYVTSDSKDKIFEREHKNLRSYYIGHKALMSFMMKMDADMVVMTMPDLGNYYIKRSLVRKDTEYLYTDHGMTSVNIGYREGALNNYDAFLCVGPPQVRELREMERVYNLKPRKLVECGYPLLDDLIASYQAMDLTPRPQKKILIAPSWQPDNILESCLDDLLEPLLGKGNQIILRPHPEFIKRFPEKMQHILDKYQARTGEDFIIESDFSSNTSIFTADLVVTDWSGIAQEFSYATKKPSLFIDTPMKVMNPEYQRISIEPLEIALRNQIGVSVKPEDLSGVEKVVAGLLARQAEYQQIIAKIVEQNVYNVGHSGEIGGEYIIQTLLQKRTGRPNTV